MTTGLAAALLTALLPGAAPPADAVRVALQQARDRQLKTSSVAVKLKHVASYNPSGKRRVTLQAPEPAVVPSETRLLIQGESLRFEGNHPVLMAPGRYVNRTRIVVRNGKTETVILPEGTNGENPLAVIYREADSFWAKRLDNAPVLMMFRGADFDLAYYDLRRFRSTGSRAAADGVVCARLESIRPSGVRETLLVDDQGLLRRATAERDGRRTGELDVRYEPRHGLPAFPVSWISKQYDRAGELASEDRVTLAEAALDDPIAPAEFEARFAPGYRVTDYRVRKEYLVEAGGDLREIEAPPASSPEAALSSRTLLVLALLVGVLFLLLLVLIVLRIRRRRAYLKWLADENAPR